MVLVLTSTLAPPPCLPKPTRVPKPDETLGDRWDKKYDELFESIDKCISLSCVLEGVDSLMYAAFFDPSVPCKLVDAQITGIGKRSEAIRQRISETGRVNDKKVPKIRSVVASYHLEWSEQETIPCCNISATPFQFALGILVPHQSVISASQL